MTRDLPNDLEAERRLLSCCMMDQGQTLSMCIDRGVNAGVFYIEPHGALFALMVEMLATGTHIDDVSVYQELVRRRMTDMFGGGSCPSFAQISSGAATTGPAPQAVEIVLEKSVLRRAIRIATRTVEDCYGYTTGGVNELLADPINQMLALSGASGMPEPSWAEVIDHASQLSDEIIAHQGKVAATIEFPWQQMNVLFGPMERGQLVVIAARTSIGKSSLARPIACHAAKCGHGVYFDTLEVNPIKVAMQMAATLSRVGVRQLGQAHPKDQTDFKAALKSLRSVGITMSRKDKTIAQIVGRSKALAAQGKLDVLVVDHGGQLADVYESSDKVSSIGRITKTLKNLATDLNCVVILLWQLNRESTRDGNREPILSDLKDSGSLEEDADKVLFIHRPNEDPITGTPQSSASTAQEQPRFFQNVIQAKGRDDGTTLMSFYFERAIATFTPAKK